MRYRSRANLYRSFSKYVADSGAELFTVEAAFGERPFEVTRPDDEHHIQLRSSQVLWLKEACLNVAIARLSHLRPNWAYVCWCDADVLFARPDWVSETVHTLQ